MPLFRLDINGTRVQDLSPLENMQLVELNLVNTKVVDLGSIKRMPLEKLNISQTDITSLEALAELPLESLYLSSCPVRSLSILANLPIKNLRLDGCLEIEDFTVLTPLKDLKRLILPPEAASPALLAQLPSLIKFGTVWPEAGWTDVPAIEQATEEPIPSARK